LSARADFITNPLLLTGFAVVAIILWLCRADLADIVRSGRSHVERININPEAAAHVHSGKVLFDQGDYDSAIAEYTEALAIDPNYAAAYGSRADTYLDKTDYDLAIADYDQAIRLYPTEAIAYFGRAVAYYNKGEYERAIAGYDEAIRLNPRYALAYTYRGVAYMNRNKPTAPSPITLTLSGPVRMMHTPAAAEQSSAIARATTSEPWSARSGPWSSRGESWPTMGRSGSFQNTPWHSAPATSPARTRTTTAAPPPVRQSGWFRK
jgi:tetratricopeptide (TPR) repeat protein